MIKRLELFFEIFMILTICSFRSRKLFFFKEAFQIKFIRNFAEYSIMMLLRRKWFSILHLNLEITESFLNCQN